MRSASRSAVFPGCGRMVAKPSVTFWLTVAVNSCREPGPQWTSMGVRFSVPIPQNQPKFSPAGRISNGKRPCRPFSIHDSVVRLQLRCRFSLQILKWLSEWSSLFPHHCATLHDKAYALYRSDILQRIAWDGDD